ncbi:MAG TPA: hypothetical protein VK597_05675 [Inquilinus sp.]|nr:hypothetical protein [Inquilinus sp.]
MIVSLASLAGLALIALGMVCTPGPNMVYLLSRSILQGRLAGAISLAGDRRHPLLHPVHSTRPHRPDAGGAAGL